MSSEAPRRFLWVTWEGGGTTPPVLSIIGRLVARGHAVRLLGDACLAADAAAVGASFQPFVQAPQRHSRTRESEITADWAAWTPLGAFTRARDRHAFAPAGRFAADVLQAAAAWPPDCIVVDAMLFGALVGAEATGRPWAAVIPMTSFLPAPGRPPPGLGLWPATGRLGRLRDRLLLGLGDRLLWRSCLPLLNRARAGVGLAPLDHPLSQIRSADRLLVLTDPGFDFAAPPVAERLLYCGPELADPVWAATSPTPPAWPRLAAPATAAPLVLVGLSSSYQAQEPLLRRAVAALGRLPVRGLITLGPALPADLLGAPSSLPPNVLVLPSHRHSELLPVTSLMLTHGGHGSVLRALAAGVPLLVSPLGRDQADNAARVEWLGAGRQLSARSSVGKLTSAIAAALESPSLRRHAQAMAARLAQPGPDRSVAALEALAGRR